MGNAQFVDISALNSDAIDWNAYKAWSVQGDGRSRIALRASYGYGYTDVHFVHNREGALAAGVDTILYYHYAYPQYIDAETAARWHYSVVGNIRPTDMYVLDFEEEVDQATAEWAYTWLSTLEQLTGRTPAIYASLAYIQSRLQDQRLAHFPLWFARWEYDPSARPAAPAPWTSYVCIQYTDRAVNIPGIPGDVDADVFVSGAVIMYGPGIGDFSHWFTDQQDGTWRCTSNGTLVMYGNLAFYRSLSLDGVSLPVIGLPLESEQYHKEADGYSWSSQQFERATMYYDPAHRKDTPPGAGPSYLAHVNPPTVQTVQTLPDSLITDVKALKDLSAKIATDAGV